MELVSHVGDDVVSNGVKIRQDAVQMMREPTIARSEHVCRIASSVFTATFRARIASRGPEVV